METAAAEAPAERRVVVELVARLVAASALSAGALRTKSKTGAKKGTIELLQGGRRYALSDPLGALWAAALEEAGSGGAVLSAGQWWEETCVATEHAARAAATAEGLEKRAGGRV